jgi:hypothetical protein
MLASEAPGINLRTFSISVAVIFTAFGCELALPPGKDVRCVLDEFN